MHCTVRDDKTFRPVLIDGNIAGRAPDSDHHRIRLDIEGLILFQFLIHLEEYAASRQMQLEPFDLFQDLRPAFLHQRNDLMVVQPDRNEAFIRCVQHIPALQPLLRCHGLFLFAVLRGQPNVSFQAKHTHGNSQCPAHGRPDRDSGRDKRHQATDRDNPAAFRLLHSSTTSPSRAKRTPRFFSRASSISSVCAGS